MYFGENAVNVLVGEDSLKDRIDALRNKLHQLLESKRPESCDVIKVSHELDLLILEYEKIKNSSNL